jgi:uncharacterized protein YbjT (DUF2867 family)
MKVVVTGSLGHVGKPLTIELAGTGHQVIVISSQPEKQKDIEALGATAAIGSLEDARFLADSFGGADAVFAMEPPNYADPDPVGYYRRLGENYAQAVQKSKVKRVVHLSSYGAHLEKDSGLIFGSHTVEGILNELENVTVTHLRPGYFYYNLYAFVEMIKEAGIMGANYGGEDKLLLVSPIDIARAAAEELTTTAPYAKVRYVVSDERTCNEVALVLGKAIGKPDLKWLTFTNEQTRESMEKKGMPKQLVALLVEMFAGIHSGVLHENYELNKPTEMGKVKIEDFAKDFASVFNQQ